MVEKVLILDYGSQYTQLIARRVRELSIYCEIHPYNKVPKEIKSFKAIILSGSPYSVQSEEAPYIDFSQIRGKIPILAICYGAQYLAHHFGGNVIPSNIREYGQSNLSYIASNEKLFNSINVGSQVWMSHSDTIDELPRESVLLASTADVKNTAYRIKGESTFAIQFHPEVYHSTEGKQLLLNFLVDISCVKQNWTSESFVSKTIINLQTQIRKEKVILGLSGGVDSTVAAVLLHRAIGSQLTCVFVNNGLLRKDEFSNVLEQYRGMGLSVKGVDASKLFIDKLAGISDPETKRKIIGNTFIEVFDYESKSIDGTMWLAQGTIYPDVIESISVNGPSATIKSHHNVGGLPDFMKLKVIEPLRMLFKDEVRRVGISLGINKSLIGRHPFPGTGLAIRILGNITHEKVTMLQEADSIFINKLRSEGLYDKVWQAGVILLPVKSVGVMGDERTYEKCVALRAVSSTDGMTADWVDLPYDFLRKVSNEIINRVKGINRVVYDISSKPPATIEWE